ncbi:MAG: sulfatase-like hydrolase/transferase [Acidimicrobiales bacterium]
MPSEVTLEGGRDPRWRWRWLSPFGLAVVVLFAVQPFVRFADNNHGEPLPLGRMALFAAGAATLAVLATLVVVARTGRDRDRVAVATAAFLLSFSSFSLWLSSIYPDRWRRLLEVVLWLIVTVALVALAYRASGHSWVRSFALFYGVIYLAIPLVSYVSFRHEVDGGERPTAGAVLPPVSAVPAERPNVYWLMLDEYGRRDQVEHYTGTDLGPFYQSLADRGFDVSESSSAAYNRTQLSLASTLTMQYLFQPGNDIRDEFDVAGPVVTGANPVVDRFRDLGYRFVYSDSGSLTWAHCSTPAADQCIPAGTNPLALDDLEMNLLRTTALAAVPVVQERFTDPVGVVDRVHDAVDPAGPPFFLFAHILSPHWPYRFSDDCGRRLTPMEAQLLPPRDRATAYGEELTCLNADVLQAVDRIIAADPTAVIILQADHGTAFTVDWSWAAEEWTPTAIQERLAPLNAIRFPTSCQHPPLDGQPLVNTFRLVFACIEGTPPELLEPRAYISSFDRVDDLREVEPSRPFAAP